MKTFLYMNITFVYNYFMIKGVNNFLLKLYF